MRRLFLASIAFAVASTTALVLPTAGADADSCSTSQSQSCAVPSAGGTRLLVGRPAPATSGSNVTGSGQLDLASLLGKPTALVFWLYTCPHCRGAMPGVARLAHKLGPDEQIVTATVDLGVKGPKGYETPKDAVKTFGLDAPTMVVSDDTVRSSWGVSSVPAAFVMDSSGTVRKVIAPKDPAALAPAIKKALANVE
jgi:thiol-disulfide isomerase/thioredoxin